MKNFKTIKNLTVFLAGLVILSLSLIAPSAIFLFAQDSYLTTDTTREDDIIKNDTYINNDINTTEVKTDNLPDSSLLKETVIYDSANDGDVSPDVKVYNSVETDDKTVNIYLEKEVYSGAEPIINQGVEIKNTAPTIMKSEPAPTAMAKLVEEILSECKVYNIYDKAKCQEFMQIPPVCRNKRITNKEECENYLLLSPECRDRGILDIAKCQEYLAVPKECRDKSISDKEECRRYLSKYTMPFECQRAGIRSEEECYKFMEAQARLTPECKNKGIAKAEDCEKFMKEKTLPAECQEKNISSREECDYILRGKANNLNVLVKVEVKTERGIEIMEIGLPEECRQAGAGSAEECEKILFKRNAPKECLDAGISTSEKCEKFMFEKSTPTDCKEAGISTMEACKKFIFEKYGGADKIPADKLPIECQKAGASTSDECDKVMRKMYLPKECQDQGITDEGRCNLYMQQKNMPKECQQAEVKTRSECDKIMFKKYGQFECSGAGAETEEECQKYMFNKYSQVVECRGIDEFQCKNSLKERHLGDIAAKQVRFKEVKDKALGLAGESIKLEKLEAKLDLAKDMMPIKRKEAGLKVLAARESMTLDEAENLVQTASVALMMDSDEDGLPDDIEERLGSDPENRDSDGDGYLDGDEFKNNYNPAGGGQLGKALAPIEKAIMENKTLGQPKTEGEESEELAVNNVINLTNEAGEATGGYSISGQATANSVVTLYIYSDLPMVVTVSADEYGNWQYNFKESLTEEEHEIYAVINDNTGKVVKKSSPLNFFVKEARAVSITDYISSEISGLPQAQQERDFVLYYIMAGFVVFIGITIYYLFIYESKRGFGR